MPYIQLKERLELDMSDDATPNPWSAGSLNYVITMCINRYLGWKGLSYSSINECVGVLECAKLELYRRIATPYEESKRLENGEVYTVRG